MASKDGYQTPKRQRKFTQAGALLAPRFRGAGGKRGFAETRLLTRWEEVCGADLAALARPVKVSYTRAGIGATLILACDGARAAELMMQTERIRERVNACYGYNAISRVRLQQEDAAGFAEKSRGFSGKAAPSEDESGPTDRDRHSAAKAVTGVTDPTLAEALTALGANILARKPAPNTD